MTVHRPAARLAAMAAAVLVLLAAPAAAAGYVDAAVAGLRGDPVYVAPAAASILSQQDAGELRQHVKEAGTPIFVAVLPAAARQEAASPGELARMIANGVRRQGSYMVVVGREWVAGNVGGTLPSGRAVELARSAFAANRGNLQAALVQWVDGVAAAREGGQAQGGNDTPGGGDTGGGAAGTVVGVAVAALLLVGGGALVLGARRRRRERERELAEVKSVAQEDLVALGEDIAGLDLDTRMPGANPEAARHHAEAVDAYQRAARILDRAARPEDLAGMSAALEAGRFSMASARAVLEGRPLPERRPPCFFDQRHGPSVEDVEWAPPGGVPRRVPACAADAQRLRDGLDPESRMVPAGGGRVPYYDAPGYYAPWYGGYFGGFGGMGGLFTGFLLGSALGGWGWGGYPVYVGGGDGGDGGDAGDGGGDWGGGDWGGGDAGGDWGGGDWGGGDAGGGDFGGGDFGGGGE